MKITHTRLLFIIVMLLALVTRSQGQTFDAAAQAAHAAIADLDNAAESKVAADAAAIAGLNAANSTLTTQNAALASDKLALATALDAKYKNFVIFPALHKLTWSVGNVGPGIGGQPPIAYGWTRSASGALVLSVTSAKGLYSDWLTAIHLYGQPAVDASRALLSVDMTTDVSTLTLTQALEMDVLIIEDGYRFELSSQINYARGGMLQISNGNSMGWRDTGIVLGKLAAGTPHRILWEYKFDRVGRTTTFVAYTLDGVRYPIPDAIASMPAYPSNWRTQICVQLQQDTNQSGGTYTTTYDNMLMLVQ